MQETGKKVSSSKLKIEHNLVSEGGLNKGKRKTNQDNHFIDYSWMQFGIYVFGICDGHGLYGHHVSNFISKNYPKILKRLVKKKCQLEEEEKIEDLLI